MKSETPLARASARNSLTSCRVERATRERAAVALHGGPRPVGGEVEAVRRAGELAPSSRRASSSRRCPPTRSRCQTAKSAYWIGSSGSARLRRREAAVERRRAPRTGSPLERGRSRCGGHDEQKWSSSGRCARGARTKQQVRARGRTDAGQLTRATPSASRLARPRAPREVEDRAASSGRRRATSCTGAPSTSLIVVRSDLVPRDDASNARWSAVGVERRPDAHEARDVVRRDARHRSGRAGTAAPAGRRAGRGRGSRLAGSVGSALSLGEQERSPPRRRGLELRELRPLLVGVAHQRARSPPRARDGRAA